MKRNKRILMIINEFPPLGESGVQRPLKFLKYLSAAGWKCFVVTPAKAGKSVLDHSLSSEIPDSARVFRTGSWGFGGSLVDRVAALRQEAGSLSVKGLLSRVLLQLNHLLFPIDKQIGWLPFAFFRSLALIKRHKIRKVYITAFPFSAFLTGVLLRLCLGRRIFWVADYRDGWQFEPLIQTRMPAWRFRLIRRLDGCALKHCDKAVFVTPSIRDQYLKAYPQYKTKLEVITNGFDEADFEGLTPHHFDRPVMVYMGKIYNMQRPDMLPLLNALQASKTDLPLIHIGSVSEDAKAAIAKGDYSFYQFLGYKPHTEALSMALGAGVNLMILNDDKASEGVYSGKIFELLRLRRPILALGPKQSLLRELIEKNKAGEYVWLRDEMGIIAALQRILENPKAYGAQPQDIRRFERHKLAQDLAALYE